MTTSIMFASEEKKESIRKWAERFHQRIPVATEEVSLETSFGHTRVLVTGPENAPPLVILHGALASSAHVLPELGPLLKTRRVYAVDVVGQSVWSEDRRLELSDDSYGRWFREVCDGLGLDKFDLYGVSWGGFVAMRAAAAVPERIQHLILLAPAGVVANGTWASLRDVGWHLLMYRAFPSEDRLTRVVRALFTTEDPDWKAYFGEAVRSYKMDMRIPPHLGPQDLAAVRCPALVFAADEDVSFPGVALLARIKELLPQAEVELLEGSKHCPPLTDAFRTQMARRIESFLAK